jgi:hypothetical protein
MSTATDVTAPTGRERRAHTRHRGADLPNIRVSRLRHGPAVSLIDLSVGGALVETDVQMRPGTSLTLEIAADSDNPVLLPMRVLRCEVARVRSEVTTYRGACEFSRPLPWPALLTTPRPVTSTAADEAIALDVSLKALVQRCRAESADAITTPEMVKVLRALEEQASQRREEELAGPLVHLLPIVATAVERSEPAANVLAAIESRLRIAIPRVNIRLTDTALPQPGDGEALLFRPDGAKDFPCVLNVHLPEGATLTDGQFRLLKASTHLCSLVAAAGLRTESPSPATAVGMSWQKIVVRYKDGRVIKGFSHDFNPGRSQFAIWPSINAPEHEGMLVPLSVLKAVFFVRDFQGDASYTEERSFDQAAHGRKLEVTFSDNEMLVGTTLSYRPDGQGFFVIPADPRANNLRVFVVTSAVRHVRFLGASYERTSERQLQLVAS